jgi:L,D-transpeptidase YcbB
MRFLALLVLPLAVTASPALGQAAFAADHDERPVTPAQQAVRDMVALDAPPAGSLPREARVWEATRRFYEQVDFELAWIREGALTPSARTLVQALRDAHSHGLDPDRYGASLLAAFATDVVPPTRSHTSHASIVTLDARLTHALLAFGRDLVRGREDPRRLGALYYTRERDVQVAGALARSAWTGDASWFLQAVTPPHQEYAALRQALERYRGIAAAGGWPGIPPRTMIDVAQVDLAGVDPSLLERIVERLTVTGDLRHDGSASWGASSSGEPAWSDEQRRAALADAVRRFQARHGLVVDGILGPATAAAMNVPVEDRLEILLVNLDRWRWVPSLPEGPAIRVNVPEFRLRKYEDGRPVADMRVVVGTEDNQTPIFNDRVEYLEVNPYWNIPLSIARGELAKARRDRAHLRRQRIDILTAWGPNGRIVEASQVDWRDPVGWLTDRGYVLRQRPGPWNAMGQIKFMFPNRFAVYVHDTPADHLFARTERAFSHGCIRAAEPMALARFALEVVDDWDKARLGDALASGRTERVVLDRHIPIQILYKTAWMEGGEVHFRNDVYGWDDRERDRRDIDVTVYTALAGASP